MDTEIKRLLILGNGFDLTCKLPTKYEDFFNYRFGLNLKCKERIIYKGLNSISEHNYQKLMRKVQKGFDDYLKNFFENPKNKNITYNTISRAFKRKLSKLAPYIFKRYKVEVPKMYIKEYKKIQQINFNEWDAILLLGRYSIKSYTLSNWCDIEWLISNVLHCIFDPKHINKIIFKDDKSKAIFTSYLSNMYRKKFALKPVNVVARDLRIELNKFENTFRAYIFNLTNNDKKKENIYYSRVTQLLESLIYGQNKKENLVDIMNFNYTLDIRIIDYFRDHPDQTRLSSRNINSWLNVHGTCITEDKKIETYIKKICKEYYGIYIQNINDFPKIIFRIDNNDISRESPLRFFTKDFRTTENGTYQFMTGSFQDKYEVITIMGHSLNEADYSYFSDIFDKLKILENSNKLPIIEYYYYPGDNDSANRLDAVDKLQNIINLYGLKHQYKGSLFQKVRSHIKILRDPRLKYDNKEFNFSEFGSMID